MGSPHRTKKHSTDHPAVAVNHRGGRKRQEISRALKYAVFFTNLLFWICGLGAIAIGIYLYANEFRPVLDALDFVLNPAILMMIGGICVFLISFLGCTGALRENVCMLKLFGISLFFSYICLVIAAFLLFLLFYSDSTNGLSIAALLYKAVLNYHANDNMKDLMDFLHTTLQCCGATSNGYKDWNLSPTFNCSTANVSPERCGVPYSCCEGADAGKTNIRCGFEAQRKSTPELNGHVYTDGCLHPLQKVFESKAVVVGAIVGAIIVPVCLSITFTNMLWKQIERQRWRLDRQARREERWKRRMRRRFRDPLAPVYTEIDETGSPHNETKLDDEERHRPAPKKSKTHQESALKAAVDSIAHENKPSTSAAAPKNSAGGNPSKSRSKKNPKIRGNEFSNILSISDSEAAAGSASKEVSSQPLFSDQEHESQHQRRRRRKNQENSAANKKKSGQNSRKEYILQQNDFTQRKNSKEKNFDEFGNSAGMNSGMNKESSAAPSAPAPFDDRDVAGPSNASNGR